MAPVVESALPSNVSKGVITISALLAITVPLMAVPVAMSTLPSIVKTHYT